MYDKRMQNIFQEVDIMLKYVETNKAPAAIGPYSQGIVVNGTAFFSGQIPLSPETGGSSEQRSGNRQSKL